MRYQPRNNCFVNGALNRACNDHSLLKQGKLFDGSWSGLWQHGVGDRQSTIE